MFDLLFQTTGLSLDRLRSFCRVAEMESFNGAAGGDPNQQTLFSRQVKELEHFFGAELFARKGRTVSLTPEGKRLYLLASEYFSALEDFKESCTAAVSGITIGAGDSLIQWLLMPRLTEIKSILGHAGLTFQSQRTQDIVENLLKGTLDYGIVRADAVVGELSAVPLGTLSYGLFGPAELIPKTLKNKQVAALHELTFAGLTGGGVYQQQMEALAQQNSLWIRYAVQCSSYPMMVKAVRTLGVAAILPLIAKDELPEPEYRSIRPPTLAAFDRPLALCWNRRLSKMDVSLASAGEKLARCIAL